MKLTNSESIQDSEKEFIDTINAELDWDAIEQLILEKHGFTVQEDVDYKDGNLIVHNNEIAYKFDFEIKVPLSIIFNREGECLQMSTRSDEQPPLNEVQEEINSVAEDLPDGIRDGEILDDEIPDGETLTDDILADDMPIKGLGLASEIADMISEINSEGE